MRFRNGCFYSLAKARDLYKKTGSREEGLEVGEGEGEEGGYRGEDVSFAMAVKDNLDRAVEVFIFEEGLAASTARADRKGLEGEVGRLGFVGAILGSRGNCNFLHGDAGI